MEEMPVRPVVLFGDPRLRHTCRPVDGAADDWRPDAQDLADTLARLRQRLGFGRALAAPQIGSPHRLIAFDCALGRFVMANPEIIWRSLDMQPVWDDCFSLPGVCMAVMRHRSVSVRFRTLDNEPGELAELPPDLAELVQHEIDHLDGILMSDRLVDSRAIISAEMAALTPHPGA